MKTAAPSSPMPVAAKARLRMQRAEATPMPDLEPSGKGFTPRRLKPDFVIRIESRHGERVQLSLHRFGKQFLLGDGQMKSARQVSRGIEMLLRYSA